MQTVFWVRLGAKKQFNKWQPRNVQAFKRKPDTAHDEVAIKVMMDIPDSYFEAPQIEVKVYLPEGDKDAAKVIASTAADIAMQMGSRVRVTIGGGSDVDDGPVDAYTLSAEDRARHAAQTDNEVDDKLFGGTV